MAELDPVSEKLGALAAEVRKQNGVILSHLAQEAEFQRVLCCVTAEMAEMRTLILGGDETPGIAAEVAELHAWLVSGRIGLRALRWLAALVAGIVGLVYMVEQLVRSLGKH